MLYILTRVVGDLKLPLSGPFNPGPPFFTRPRLVTLVDESFLSFVVTLDGLSTSLVLAWPEMMTVTDEIDKNSHESQFSSTLILVFPVLYITSITSLFV